jgi:nucleosome binding factor SPN SPT16 subunit
MKLYAVRNSQGQFFHAIGYGGYGPSWVDTLDAAKFYTKLGTAKGRVTYFYNEAQKSKKLADMYPACEILEFTIEPSQAVVINLAEEVAAKAKKKAEKELKDQLARKAEKLRELERQQANLLYQIRSLQTS